LCGEQEFALTIAQHGLVEDGHEFETAGNGGEAFEMLQTNHYRMVISDWQMPEMTGVELCRAIRTADADQGIVVVDDGSGPGYASVFAAAAAAGAATDASMMRWAARYLIC